MVNVPRNEIKRPNGALLVLWYGEGSYRFHPGREPEGEIEYWRDGKLLASRAEIGEDWKPVQP